MIKLKKETEINKYPDSIQVLLSYMCYQSMKLDGRFVGFVKHKSESKCTAHKRLRKTYHRDGCNYFIHYEVSSGDRENFVKSNHEKFKEKVKETKSTHQVFPYGKPVVVNVCHEVHKEDIL